MFNFLSWLEALEQKMTDIIISLPAIDENESSRSSLESLLSNLRAEISVERESYSG